jgi:hypothetical protein
MPHGASYLWQYELDSARPHDGFTKITVAGQSLPAARLLGLVGLSSAASIDMRPRESYVRGPDLIATYEESRQAPIRVDCLWRAMPPGVADQVLATIDLVVSVRTCAFDSHPELAVASVVPANEILRLQCLGPADWTPQSLGPATIVPDSGTGCLLLRIAGSDLSYVEMVHPADFQYDELQPTESGGQAARVTHRLFRTNLEKGVILRGRVRGIFLKRFADLEIAAQCYAAFAGADPPLGA